MITLNAARLLALVLLSNAATPKLFPCQTPTSTLSKPKLHDCIAIQLLLIPPWTELLLQNTQTDLSSTPHHLQPSQPSPSSCLTLPPHCWSPTSSALPQPKPLTSQLPHDSHAPRILGPQQSSCEVVPSGYKDLNEFIGGVGNSPK